MCGLYKFRFEWRERFAQCKSVVRCRFRLADYLEIAKQQERVIGCEVDKAEAETLGQDDYADQFENFGKGKKDALAKVMDAVGSVPAAKYRVDAEKYRAEAARLRDELAQTESQNQSSVGVPAP
jgi:hypothetical protein